MKTMRTLLMLLAHTPSFFLKVASIAMAVFIFYPAAARSQAGTPAWTNRYDGPANDFDMAYAIAVGTNGSVYVSGDSHDLVSDSDRYVTISYSSAGMPLWTNIYSLGTRNNDEFEPVAAIAVGDRNVYVTGFSFSGSSCDYVTLAYSTAGMPLD